MGRTFAAPLVMVASLLGLAACGGSKEAVPLAGVVRTPPLEVGDVSLRRADTGETVPMKADAGDLLIVYFGYTSCPDICPTTLSDVQVALGDLDSAERERVTVAMETVDPERDTDEVMTNYLAHFAEDGWPLRTTDAEALASAAKAFGVQYEIADHEPGDDTYDVGHTAVTYVVNDAGTVMVEWPFGLESESMTSDLQQLLEEAQS